MNFEPGRPDEPSTPSDLVIGDLVVGDQFDPGFLHPG